MTYVHFITWVGWFYLFVFEWNQCNTSRTEEMALIVRWLPSQIAPASLTNLVT
jgi:hypothetical protein